MPQEMMISSTNIKNASNVVGAYSSAQNES